MAQGKYVLDTPYTWSYFDFQNPLLLAYAAALNGYGSAALDKNFTYCDLGCGNGVSVNLLASIYPNSRFTGVDINGEHIENAKKFAKRGKLTNVTFRKASFAQFTVSKPSKFDVIALHGIYSWVEEAHRLQAADFVREFLKPGGKVYVSYNCFPGWSELLPVWKMMQGYIADKPQSSKDRVQQGLAEISFLLDNDARFFKVNKSATKFVQKLRESDPNYVAHELGNGVSAPHYFIDIANEMQGLGLQYGGTAKLHRNKTNNIIARRFRKHINGTLNSLERESRKSFIRNEVFRRDIYVNAPQVLPSNRSAELFLDTLIGATVVDRQIKDVLDLGYRKKDLKSPLFLALVPLAACGWYTVGELIAAPELSGFEADDIINAVHDLIAGYQFQPISERVTSEIGSTDGRFLVPSALNLAFLEDRIWAEGKAYLGSEILGCALRVRFVEGVIVRALHDRTLKDAEKVVKKQLIRLTVDDERRLSFDKDIVTSVWLGRQMQRFKEQRLPILMRYDIVRAQ